MRKPYTPTHWLSRLSDFAIDSKASDLRCDASASMSLMANSVSYVRE